ncbi:maleylpyruvate isomerase family mycothiol-dependent enzyme [Nocardioides sp.]|uniref:maleylpyruvate isomerase family mycothiol-dependent enzyme n=1 Tax=Nocardioides sp. TaxID=35761 RepID=UPI001A245628|nr:maleylpyruvate isomerase family mycothiol-dependent enzyme [Nocardioides sp.]MBJ7355802.1 maleylpyruvate isomerase family mycothiol-dependent enzyme [Nocardioides sp.]
MPTHLTPEEHLAGLRDAVVAFVRYVDRAGPAAAVPTCPDWTVLDLVAHQGMVHRWAAALVRGERPDDEAVAAFEAQGRAGPDLVGWLRDGALEVTRAVAEAPEDRAAPVFLHDAPAPRRFWARRQCHETTIHAVDALSASLGRPPRADETWVDPALALDGIDELLGGFLTRPRSRLRCEEDALLVVVPEGATDWWEVALGPRPAVVTRHRTPYDGAADPDWEVTGSAVELYLRLWNRTDPADPVDEDWRHLTAVRWS